MKKKQKIILAVVILLMVITGGIIYLNNYLKNEIVDVLQKEYPASGLSYDDISINILAGNATIKNLRIKEGILSLETPEVTLKDFSYADYLEKKNITIGSIHLFDPEIIINKSDSTSTDNNPEEEPYPQEIRVKNFLVSGGNIRLIENDSAANTLFASLENIHIGNIALGKKPQQELLPFSYETISLKSDSLYYEMNSTHYLQAKLLNLENEDVTLDDFSIIPKFSKEVFDQSIPYEQDWIALKIDAIKLKGYRMQKVGELSQFIIPFTVIENAHLEMYRNKMVNDDVRIKPMYSEMLRDLDFKISLDSIQVSGSYIEYQEKVLDSRSAGKLSFHNVYATINNITNLNLEAKDFPTTRIKARALFMGETEITLNWNFDISNKMDEFRISGQMASISADQINPFLIPAMNVAAEGKIESLNYDFYGNRNQASGSMQLSYRDFKVNILKDGKQEKKSFLSGLANLILKNDRINEDLQQENISTTRDKTKSFWNFFWLCIRDGALSTFF